VGDMVFLPEAKFEKSSSVWQGQLAPSSPNSEARNPNAEMGFSFTQKSESEFSY
jgi:hypothetical protein